MKIDNNYLVENINLFESRTFFSKINIGNNLVNKGAIKKIEAQSEDNIVKTQAYLVDNKDIIKTNISWKKDNRFSYDIIESCQCSACKDYSRYYLCEHMYAAIKYLALRRAKTPQFNEIEDGYENIEHDFINQRYDKNIHSLLNSMTSLGQTPLIIDQNWQLFPEVCNDGEVRFRVALPKKYLIKNLSRFVVDVTNGHPQTFGKSVFKLTKDSLEDESILYYDFITACLLDAFNHQATGKYVSHIYIEHHIDLFYKLFSELTPEIDFKANDVQLFFDETTIDIYLSENADGLSVNISLDPSFLRQAIQYYGTSDTLLIKDVTNEISAYHFFKINEYSLAFLEELLKNGGSLDISKSMCDQFLNISSAYAGKTLRFHYNNEVIQNKYDFNLYFDINDDNLLACDLKASINGEETTNDWDLRSESPALANIYSIFEPLIEKQDKKTNTLLFDPGETKVIDLIRYGISTLQRYASVYVTDRVKNITRKIHYNFALGLRYNNGLLSVNLSSDQLNPEEIARILDSYKKRKKFYKLRNGNIINLDNAEIEKASQLIDDLDVDTKNIIDGQFNVGAYRLASIEEQFKDTHFRITRDETFSKQLQLFQNAAATEFALDTKYKDIFREYQVNGYQWIMYMLSCGFNPILADDMGLGKTVQVLSVIESMKSQGPTLVICPATLVYNWQNECEKFKANLKTICIIKDKAYRQSIYEKYQDYDLLITSYDYAKRDEDLITTCQLNLVILDEAQYIKNTKTKNAMIVKSIPSKHRLALTGTPIENTLAELWSIFDFLMPGYLYTYPYFKKRYEAPIVVNNDEKAKLRLQSMVKPFILRRVKKDVLKELPEKIEKVQTIYFGEKEKEIYNANLALANKRIREMDLNDNRSKFAMFALLLKLRQICCDPNLLYENFEEQSSKCEAAFDIIENVKQEHGKVLLFSSFTSMLDILAKKAQELGISYYMLTGSDNKEKRATMVENFQNDDTTLFLISLKAGGTGLNLTAANTVIHYDPWWNQSATNQATDRAYRIGQNNNVFVYKLVMKDSIEEKIVKMQEQKQQLSDDFIQANDTSIQSLSKEAIIDLFKD